MVFSQTRVLRSTIFRSSVLRNIPQQLANHMLDTTSRPVEVDLLMQRIAGQQELLCRRKSFFGKTEGCHFLHGVFSLIRGADVYFGHADIVDQPVKVDCAGTCTRHHSVALKVVEAVRIKGTGDNRVIDVGRVIRFQQASHFIAKAIAMSIEEGSYRTIRVPDNLGGPFFMPLLYAT